MEFTCMWDLCWVFIRDAPLGKAMAITDALIRRIAVLVSKHGLEGRSRNPRTLENRLHEGDEMWGCIEAGAKCWRQTDACHVTRVLFVGSNKVGAIFYAVEYRRRKGEVACSPIQSLACHTQ
jgi:hypothetical protein